MEAQGGPEGLVQGAANRLRAPVTAAGPSFSVPAGLCGFSPFPLSPRLGRVDGLGASRLALQGRAKADSGEPGPAVFGAARRAQ